MLNDSKYLLKNGLALMKVAREMMTMAPGDRVPPMSEYVDKFGVAKGTIQGIFKQLEGECIALEKKGHLGTYIQSIDHKKLWQYSGWVAITGLMPICLNDRLRSLATAVTLAFEKMDIPFRLAFMQSAQNRYLTLTGGQFDFIVTSKLAGEKFIKENDKLSLALELSDNSYNRGIVCAFQDDRKTVIEDGMTLACDPDARDQWLLTKLVTKGKKVNLIKMPYRATLHSFFAGKTDAIIYHSEAILSADRKYAIQDIPGQALSSKVSKAVVITNCDNYFVNALLQKILLAEEVCKDQLRIEAGESWTYY